MTGQDRTDGPDELAEAIDWMRKHPAVVDSLGYSVSTPTLRHAATIVRAVLARPDTDGERCKCGHPRYMHLNSGDWCKGGGWHDRHGADCGCAGFARRDTASARPDEDERERVAEAAAAAMGHTKGWDAPECPDADTTFGCQHEGGHPLEPGCDDCAAPGWPCETAYAVADAALAARAWCGARGRHHREELIMITCILSSRDRPDQVVQMDVPHEGQRVFLPADPDSSTVDGRVAWVSGVTYYPLGGLNLNLSDVPPDGPYVIVDLSPRPPLRVGTSYQGSR